MDLLALDMSSLQGMNLGRLSECETEIRQRLNMIRLDIFSEKGKYTAEKRKLRKSLARVKTVCAGLAGRNKGSTK